MNDNYLWDRSGEPDTEVQELEELLGTLRYKPQPFEIPAHIQPGSRRNFFPAMAIAAAIALFAVLVGLWFGLNRRQSPVLTANNNSRIEQTLTPPAPPAPSSHQTAGIQNEPKPAGVIKHGEAIARRQTRVSPTVIRQAELTPQEMAEK